jgi:peptide/nickel transport system substrate-binding protein
MNRWLHSLIALALLGSGSCSQTSNPGKIATGKDAGRITVGTTQLPRTLDPADAYEAASIALIRNLSDRLYTYDPGSTELKPQLATALPKVSADGLTYTIPLRQGVVFHDGTAFDAAAMKFSLDRFIQNKGKPAFLLAERVAEITATSPYVLTIKLKKPFTAFPSMLAFVGTCAVSPKAYKIGANQFEANTFVGTGPYKLSGSASSDRVKFDVFDRYWGDKPRNNGVNLQIFNGNAANLFNSFRTGAVDVAFQALEPDQVRSLEEGAKEGKWQAIALDGSVTGYLILNVLQKPLDNPLVRQAMAAIVDRPMINERVLYGQGKPLYSIVPDTFDVSVPVFKNAYGDGNIAKAKQLLTKAGFSPQNPAKIQIWYPSSSANSRLTAGFLRAYAKQKLGGMLEIEPNTIERASYFKYVSKNIYPATLQNWYPDFLDPDNFVQPFLECPKGNAKEGCMEGGSQSQGSFYYSDRMNQAISAQGSEQDPIKRKAIYADIQAQIQQDVPLIPLWQTKDFVFARKGMSGVAIDPLQNLLYADMKK